MPLTDEQLREWEALLPKVTRGPWRKDVSWLKNDGPIIASALNHIIAEARQSEDDAAHIARCDPQTIGEVLRELLELRDFCKSQCNELAISEARYACFVDAKTARIRNAALDEAWNIADRMRKDCEADDFVGSSSQACEGICARILALKTPEPKL